MRADEYNSDKTNHGVKKMKKHLFLTGPSGIGKTTIIRQALGTAAGVAEWFKNPQAQASAHYVVDEGETIYRCVKETDTAWHCGDGQKHPVCRNWNSIGIEIRPRKLNPKRIAACDADWFFDKRALDNAEWLIRRLMKQYKIPASNILRHYDVSGKLCPRPFVGDDTNSYYHPSAPK